MSEMTDEERAEGLNHLMTAEAIDPKPNWYWLSFVDPEAPEGQRFLGVAIVHAIGPILAVWKSKALGINPGGEVCIQPLTYDPDRAYCDRLLDKDEAHIAGRHDG